MFFPQSAQLGETFCLNNILAIDMRAGNSIEHIVDVINESNGFLSDDISEEAYYMALKRFLDTDQAVLDDMRQRLIQAYKPYSMTECAANYETLFRQDKNEKER